jgi:hypothetical protein
MEQKRCPKCGETKSVNEFYKHSRSTDGLQSYCKECQKHLWQNNYHNKARRDITATTEAGENPLARFTPRQLMLELKSRGYKGTLEHVQRVDFNSL